MVLDHVAVLTVDIEQFCTANRLSSQEPVEVFPDTGSRELYVDGDHVGGRLLVIQPHGEGPYQRALAKRGPGLHHLGIATANLTAALAEWHTRGWQIHPASAAAINPDRGAFLFQRGVPTLIELFVGMTDISTPAVEVVLAARREVLPGIVGVRASTAESALMYRDRALQM